MTSRVLNHGNAPTATGGAGTMTEGVWSDLSVQGQFLVDLEFLTRHTQPSGAKGGPPETACVYTKAPSYLKEIACQFAWVHFYAFSHGSKVEEEEDEEYDPAAPGLVKAVPASLVTEHNRTTSPYEFSKDSAVTLSQAKAARDANRLVMICHGESETRQLVLHALLRADHSLLDISGPIPSDYIAGEIVLPVFIRQSKVFVSLVAHGSCMAAEYDSEVFEEEISEFFILVCSRGTLGKNDWGVCACRLFPGDAARDGGVRPSKQGFNHFRLCCAVPLVPPVRPPRDPTYAARDRGSVWDHSPMRLVLWRTRGITVGQTRPSAACVVVSR